MNNKLLFTILAFICMASSSCTDELYPKNESNSKENPTNKMNPSLERLHSLQVDKQMMLSSMIRYDSSKGIYLLDLSLKDAVFLDISKENYDEVNSLVSKMNEHNSLKH